VSNFSKCLLYSIRRVQLSSQNRDINLAALTVFVPILVGFVTTLPQKVQRRRAHDSYHFCKVMDLGVSTF
jgi:hypothetical protein